MSLSFCCVRDNMMVVYRTDREIAGLMDARGIQKFGLCKKCGRGMWLDGRNHLAVFLTVSLWWKALKHWMRFPWNDDSTPNDEPLFIRSKVNWTNRLLRGSIGVVQETHDGL